MKALVLAILVVALCGCVVNPGYHGDYGYHSEFRHGDWR